MQGTKHFQRWHHFGQRIFHSGGNAQRALEFGVLAARLVNGELRRFKHAQAALIKPLARLCQGQPAGVAREQSNAQLSFQALDIEAHHRPGLP